MRGLAWRIILVVGILTTMAAVGGLSEARSAANAETEKPTCNATLIAGPPQQVTLVVQDAGSGLVSLVITESTNADTIVPPFTPGTTDPVDVMITKIDQTKTAVVRLTATDGDGNPRQPRASHGGRRLPTSRRSQRDRIGTIRRVHRIGLQRHIKMDLISR